MVIRAGRVGGTVALIILVLAVISILTYIYFNYAVPTKGRYCRLSTSSEGFKILSTRCSDGRGSIVLLAINTYSKPVLALTRNLTICLIGSNGRVACELYRVNSSGITAESVKVVRPGEGVKVILNYSLNRFGITVSVKLPWLPTSGDKTFYFTKAARSRVFYISISWAWPEYGGRSGVSKTLSIVCKNWISP